MTATFNEQVVNFDDSKIQLTNATLSGFTQSGNAYTFNITPTAEGEVQILIPQLVTQDLAKNFNEEGKLIRYYDTTSPTVNVSSTMVGSIHLPGEEIPFTWSATDNNLAGDAQLSYSIDGGSTWIAIGTYPITPSEYVWIAPDVDSSNIYFKIVTADEAGNNASAQVGL